jgi:hypothetical protein
MRHCCCPTARVEADTGTRAASIVIFTRDFSDVIEIGDETIGNVERGEARPTRPASEQTRGSGN